MKKIALLPLLLIFIGLSAQNNESSDYGSNLITLSPFSAYGSDDIGDVFISLGYEYFVKEKVSLSTFGAIGLSDEGYQFGFGPKVYPAGHDKAVSFGITPMFIYTSAISDNRIGFF